MYMHVLYLAGHCLSRLQSRLPRYKVTLVREGSYVSEHNPIRTPEDVSAIMSPEYENEVFETAMMLALDTKNKVIGVFTVSTVTGLFGVSVAPHFRISPLQKRQGRNMDF